MVLKSLLVTSQAKNFLVVDIEKELNPSLKISKSLKIDLLSEAWTCIGKTKF